MPGDPSDLLQLASTLGLSQATFDERLRILELGPVERGPLAQAGAGLEGERDRILDGFYDRLRRNPATGPLLADDQAVERLKRQQAAYLRDLLAAPFDWEHALRCLHIGVVHHRVRLLPQWFVASYAHLICEHVPLLLRQAPGPAAGAELVATLVKSALCDASLTLDGYAMTAEAALTRQAGIPPAAARADAAPTAPAAGEARPVMSQVRGVDDSVTDRCAFLGLDEPVRRRLREAGPTILAAIPETVDAFYAMVARWPQADPLIPPGALDRLRRSLHAYWRELVEADFGRTYAASRTLIGMVHERIGLSAPRYLIGLASQLVLLIRRLARAPDPAAAIDALLRAVFFDVSYVIQAYVDARAQAVLRTDAFASELLADLSAGVAVVDAQLRLQSVNPALLALLGAEAGLLRHAPLSEVLPEERVIELVRSAWRHPASRRAVLFDHRGRRFKAAAVRLAQAPGGGGAVALVLDDVSELVEAHSEARRTEQRLGDLIEATQAFAWEADDETWTPTLVSRSSQEVTGHRDTALLGRRGSLAALIPEPDRALFLARCRALGPGEKASVRHRLTRADGSIAWFRSDVGRLHRGDGTRLGGISIDVTEAHLEEERRLESLGRFAGGAAHEYNNRLTVVLTNLQVLLADPALRPGQRELIQEVVGAADQSARLTRRILAYAQRQVLRPRALVLNEVVDAARPTLLRLLGADVALELDLEPGLWPCFLDRAEAEAMLLDLAANARAAMPRGGRLRLVTRNVQAAPAEAAGPPRRDQVELLLEDDGEGMAPAVRARAFEPFFTTRTDAIGLGLSFVKGFVVQSGGEVSLDSRPGLWTRVRVLFPRLGAAAEGAAASAARGQPFVLLVDDHAALRRTIHRLVVGAGFDCLAVGTMAEALELLGARPVDVLLTDVALANGESGVRLARLARADRLDLPVVFISGYTRGELALERLTDGEWFLGKPFDPDELVALLRQAVAWARAHASRAAGRRGAP